VERYGHEAIGAPLCGSPPEMLIDANQLPDNSRIDCEVCIAGSGPAGITIAAELAGAPIRVCLLEVGGLSARATVAASTIAEQSGVLIDPVKYQRHMFGGGSNRWGGLSGRWFRAKPLDPIDFEARPWVAHSGWPFGYDVLRPFSARAGRILQLPSLGDCRRKAERAWTAAEFHNDRLRTSVFLMAKPLRFGTQYRALLTHSANVEVYFHGRVTEIEEDPISPVIRHFRVATPAGKTHRIAAKYFVLACGGLENPRLLLASRSKTAAGVGNQHDQVGRYFMQHPKGLHGLAVLNHEALRAPFYTGGGRAADVRICGGISFSEGFQRQHGLLNHCIMFRPVFSLSEGYMSQLYRASQRLRHGADWSGGRRELLELARFAASALKRAFEGHGAGTLFSILNHMEQIPNPESRLELSSRRDRFGVPQLRIDWRIDSLEKASLCRLHEVVRDCLAAEGRGRFDSQLDRLADDWPIAQDSAHHIGTTRMQLDPRQGVTDAQGRVHDVQNLFVSGSSLLPTSGSANPTFTILALAIRLADHLKALCGASDAVRADRCPSGPAPADVEAEDSSGVAAGPRSWARIPGSVSGSGR
jgi:choline dehydrogenase-like flavoprotein